MAEDRRKQQAWRSGSTKPAFVEPGKKARGVGKRFAVIALILIIVGVVGGLLFYLRPAPKPIFLGIAVTQYANRSYPPNSWAQQDSDKLRERFGSDSAQAFQAQEKKGLLDLLTQLADRTSQSSDKGRPIVVHLSAHAAARDGKVFLLPGDADPDNPSSYLAIEEVLSILRRSPGARLLLLDLAKPIADAHAGLLIDNVADVLHDQLTRTDQAGDLPFLVLTSCGKGEIANLSLELQRSIFGFFVEQGLLGRADGWNPTHETDGNVSARELAEYVRVQVSNWAAHEERSPQTPTLYGQGKDFVVIKPLPPPPIQLPEAPPNYPEWLQKGWQERDAWGAAEVFRQLPRTFRELESLLLQSEERWLAGDPDEAVKSELAGKLADLISQRDELKLKKIEPLSLAEARSLEVKDEKAVSAAIRPLLDRIKAKIPLKPEDMKPLLEKPPEPEPFAVIASQTLAAMIDIPDPTPEQLKDFDQLVKVFPPRFIEYAAFHFLVDVDPDRQNKWNDKDLVGVRRVVLQTARASEEAVAIDPRCFPWLKTALAAADAKHREGLVQLATGGTDPRVEGLKKLKEAIESFNQIAQKAQDFKRGFERLEEASVLLPALVQPFSRRARDGNSEKLWSDLVTETAKLQQLLGSTQSEPSRDEINSLSEQLQFNLNRARSQFQAAEADKQIRLSSKDNGPTAADLRRLMDCSLWSAADRVRLHNSACDLGQSSAKAAIEQAAATKPGASPASGSGQRIDNPAGRARLAIDLLRLDGLTDVKPLEQSLDHLDRDARDGKPVEWESLGEAIRKAWAVVLPEKYRKLADPLARERAGVVVQSVDLSALPESPDRLPMEATPELRRNQFREMWRWLANERYRKSAESMLKVSDRPDLAAFGNRLEEIAGKLQRRAP